MVQRPNTVNLPFYGFYFCFVSNPVWPSKHIFTIHEHLSGETLRGKQRVKTRNSICFRLIYRPVKQIKRLSITPKTKRLAMWRKLISFLILWLLWTQCTLNNIAELMKHWLSMTEKSRYMELVIVIWINYKPWLLKAPLISL